MARDATDHTMRTSRALAAVAVVLVLGSASCTGSGGGSDDSEGGDAATAMDRAAGDGSDAAEGMAPTDAEPVAVDAGTVGETNTAQTRDRIFTANLEIEVEVLEDAVDEATGAVEALGGFSANEDVDLGERRQATVTYRIPADRFDEAVDALAGVGELQTQRVDTEDVTSQYADLEGRVTTLRTSISRLQGFLAEATDVNQIAALEGELTRREAELESTESQRRALAESIELSTITVSFTGSGSAAPVDETRNLPTFLGGLETGWDIFVAVAAFAVSAIGFLAPFLAAGIVVLLVLRWVLRRRRPTASTGA